MPREHVIEASFDEETKLLGADAFELQGTGHKATGISYKPATLEGPCSVQVQVLQAYLQHSVHLALVNAEPAERLTVTENALLLLQVSEIFTAHCATTMQLLLSNKPPAFEDYPQGSMSASVSLSSLLLVCIAIAQ